MKAKLKAVGPVLVLVVGVSLLLYDGGMYASSMTGWPQVLTSPGAHAAMIDDNSGWTLRIDKISEADGYIVAPLGVRAIEWPESVRLYSDSYRAIPLTKPQPMGGTQQVSVRCSVRNFCRMTLRDSTSSSFWIYS